MCKERCPSDVDDGKKVDGSTSLWFRVLPVRVVEGRTGEKKRGKGIGGKKMTVTAYSVPNLKVPI